MIDVVPQSAAHGRDEMKDLFETLEGHQFLHDDAAIFADATEIVALEIGDHAHPDASR